MGANSSSAHGPKSSISAEEEAQREAERKYERKYERMAAWEAEQKLLARAEYRQRLFPIESIMEDADLSPSFPQRHGKQICPSHLSLLPPEIIQNMLSSLDNRSIKSLRLTCRRLGAIAALRINRVFLSANPLNIQVFRAIADHDVLRHRIVEIVYDDARLCHRDDSRLWRHRFDALEPPHRGAPDYIFPGYCEGYGPRMEWFEEECDWNLFDLSERQKDDDPKRPGHAALVRRVHAGLSPEESREYYDGLLRQQEEVMASGADADALRYGLQRFPALRKITVTPATHGWLFTPLYETPMIRAFPYGFNYPIPRAWPYAFDNPYPLQVAPWQDEKTIWRGFNLVTKILAEGRHNVLEYEIDGHHLGTGLNCRIFDDRCNEYEDFVSVLCLPGFKKLRLSLFVGGQHRLGWPALRNGLLRKALAEATQLEHVSIATGWFEHAWECPPPGLGRFLPLECWPKLQHFELWHVDVDLADLLSVVSQLPDGLLSLQLNSLHMCSGCYRELLDQMRDRLHWCEQRPQARVMIGVPPDRYNHYIPGRMIWLEKEIDDFFKRGGINPFEQEDTRYLHLPRFGMGVVHDAFDMDYVRPWVKQDNPDWRYFSPWSECHCKDSTDIDS